MWKQRLIPVALGLVVLVLLAALRIADPAPVQAMRDVTFDTYQRLAPREAVDRPIRIVDIDEASLAAIGQWPWPRDILAELTTRLAELGAASIAFDIMFPEPDRLSPSNLGVAADGAGALRDHDQEFAAALRAAPAVLGFDASSVRGLPMAIPPKVGFAVVGPNTAVAIPPIVGATTSLPILVEAATGHGAISLDPGNDIGTVRRLPLLWGSGNQLYPTLSLSGAASGARPGSLHRFCRSDRRRHRSVGPRR